MSFDEASELLRSRRSLVKLQARHRAVLESWIVTQAVTRGGDGGGDGTRP